MTEPTPQQTEAEDPDRRVFAMAALQALVSRPESGEMLQPTKLDTMTRVAWAIADSMIRTRSSRERI